MNIHFCCVQLKYICSTQSNVDMYNHTLHRPPPTPEYIGTKFVNI